MRHQLQHRHQTRQNTEDKGTPHIESTLTPEFHKIFIKNQDEQLSGNCPSKIANQHRNSLLLEAIVNLKIRVQGLNELEYS